MLATDLFVDLVSLPDLRGVPFAELLQGMRQAGFEPGACRALLERVQERLKVSALRPQGVEDGGLLVREEVLFPPVHTWWAVFQGREDRSSSRLPEEAVQAVADFLRLATHSEDLQAVRGAWPFESEQELARLVVPATPGAQWPEPRGPGVYRREHASVLIRSRTTGLLADPICLQRRLSRISEVPVGTPPGLVQAVAITHGHVDHWHLPSLMAVLERPELPVLVPRVPRPSLLTFQDFAASLRACGQAVQAPAWGETVRVGDMEVDVLPFYGEQPLREGARLLEGLRNWGNCYRINTEDFSCLLLVDGGADPEGNMVEVVAESCRRRGPADLVLACQREFLSPFFGGLHHYWAALPWEQLVGLYEDLRQGRLRSATAGVEGLVEVCAAAKARYFLPYANGFEGLGHPITDIGWGEGEPSEASRNALMREELARRGVATQVVDWSPGDSARMAGGRLELGPLRAA